MSLQRNALSISYLALAALVILAVQVGGAAVPLWKHGGCIDPDGKPVPCEVLEHGPCIDPNGKPAPCEQLELGGCIDPNGKPAPCQAPGTGSV